MYGTAAPNPKERHERRNDHDEHHPPSHLLQPPAMSGHPLSVGVRVRHYGQQWPSARTGTATVREVKGPCNDGTWEYRVLTTQDFARRPGPDNPETRETWWNSTATVAAKEPPR